MPEEPVGVVKTLETNPCRPKSKPSGRPKGTLSQGWRRGERLALRRLPMGNAKQAEANRNDADAFAESLRPIVAPFIHLSSRRIAKVLNDRAASNRQPARRGNLSPCCAWWNA